MTLAMKERTVRVRDILFEQRHFARMVKYLAGYRCQQCGQEGTSKTLHAHHKIPVRRRGRSTIDNGLCLCENCHRKARSSSIRVRFPLIQREAGGRARGERLGYIIPYIIPEGTPNWLAREFGISGRDVRSFLRKRYPRRPEEYHSRWGMIPLQVQGEIKEVLLNLSVQSNLKLSNETLELLLGYSKESPSQS